MIPYAEMDPPLFELVDGPLEPQRAQRGGATETGPHSRARAWLLPAPCRISRDGRATSKVTAIVGEHDAAKGLHNREANLGRARDEISRRADPALGVAPNAIRTTQRK